VSVARIVSVGAAFAVAVFAFGAWQFWEESAYFSAAREQVSPASSYFGYALRSRLGVPLVSSLAEQPLPLPGC
jgi:hypothetical protein